MEVLAELRDSVADDHSSDKLEKILVLRQGKREFFGYEFRVSVKKEDNDVYQDGSPLTKVSLKLYHSMRRGRIHDIKIYRRQFLLMIRRDYGLLSLSALLDTDGVEQNWKPDMTSSWSSSYLRSSLTGTRVLSIIMVGLSGKDEMIFFDG